MFAFPILFFNDVSHLLLMSPHALALPFANVNSVAPGPCGQIMCFLPVLGFTLRVEMV